MHLLCPPEKNKTENWFTNCRTSVYPVLVRVDMCVRNGGYVCVYEQRMSCLWVWGKIVKYN